MTVILQPPGTTQLHRCKPFCHYSSARTRHLHQYKVPKQLWTRPLASPARLGWKRSRHATSCKAAASTSVPQSEDHCFSPLTHDKSDEELAHLAAEWGYDQIGRPFPSGVTRETLSGLLPPETVDPDPVLFAMAVGKGIAIYGACVWASLVLPSSIVSWLAPFMWFLMGTAYTGLFAVASDCAHFAGLSTNWISEVYGSLAMAVSLYPYITWRLHYTGHVLRPCTLDYDVRAWRPVTTSEADELKGWGRFATKLVLTTPLKFLSSLGHWFHCWDGLDLKIYHPSNRAAVLLGWIPPVLFAGFVLPEVLARVGFAGLCHLWLMPMLVFHGWLSTLSLVAHTAPHIPWRQYGPEWDEGQAVVNGTVTLGLPRWLEWLLNDANYRLPAQVSMEVPCYHLRQAHRALADALGPYLTLASLNVWLFDNFVKRWQVYDEEAGTYTPLSEPLLTQQDKEQLQERLDRVLTQEQQDKMRQTAAAAQQQAQDTLSRVVPPEQQQQIQQKVQDVSYTLAQRLGSALQDLQAPGQKPRQA